MGVPPNVPASVSSITYRFATFFSSHYSTMLMVKRSYDDWLFKQIWYDRKRIFQINRQNVNVKAHQAMGSDIAVSNFVIDTCDGQVRDHQAIKAAGAGLLTEAMDNFIGLEDLELLDLSRNPRLDDFSCDMLSRIFRQSSTLKSIDLSYNPRISIHGLNILFRIPSIRTITAIDTRATNHDQIDVFALAAEDEKKCQVFVHGDGTQFKLPELEKLRSEN